jgi:exopolysaccharide biosynthesis polyprenyl glycosylphosphotransferase
MLYPILLILGDFVAILAAFTIAYILRVQVDTRPLVNNITALDFIQAFLMLIPLWLIINAFLGLYSKNIYEKRIAEFSRVAVGAFIGMLMIIGFDYLSDFELFPARLVVVYAFILALSLLTIVRNILWQFRRIAFKYGYGLRSVALIGNTVATKELAILFRDTKGSGYDIKLIIGGREAVPAGFAGKTVSNLDRGLSMVHELGVNSLIQTEFYEEESKNHKILMTAREHHLSYKFIPAQSEFYGSKNTVEVFNGFPMVSIHQTPLIGWGRVVKRLFDIAFSALMLIIAIPIMIPFALIIKISDPKGPVIYKHRRITRFGTQFNIYKLRSMYWKYSTGQYGSKKTDLEIFKELGREDLIAEFNQNQKVSTDPRIMPIGRFIRATSIDELPQLFNVIKGDISLVGPRAIVEDELKRYKKYSGGSLITSVKSGITGLWQVSGRSEISYEERVKLDTFYVQNWSFWLDIKILLKTVLVVLKRTGAE